MKTIFYGGMSSSSGNEFDYVRALFDDVTCFNSALMAEAKDYQKLLIDFARAREKVLVIGKSLGAAVVFEETPKHLQVFQDVNFDVRFVTIDMHTNFMIKFSRGYGIYNQKRKANMPDVWPYYYRLANFYQHTDGLKGCQILGSEDEYNLSEELVDGNRISHETIMYSDTVKNYLLKLKE